MQKLIIAAIVVLLLFPFLIKLMPKPLTLDRFEQGFKKSGMAVSEIKHVPPSLEAIDQLSFTIDGSTVDIYQYDDEGKIAKNYEYQKPDVGQAIVETWNLSESLGAAKPHSIPTSASRRGKFFVVVASEDASLRAKVIELFNTL